MYGSMHYDSPLGMLTLAGDAGHITGLWMAGQKYFGATASESLPLKPELPAFVAARRWLDAYFAGKRPHLGGLALAPSGSAFRQAVWECLCEIPYGEVTTYGRIAQKVAAKMGRSSMSGQAVGGAVGHNPIAILIPCHRVVGSGGGLTGFAGGVERKAQLLELEGVPVSCVAGQQPRTCA